MWPVPSSGKPIRLKRNHGLDGPHNVGGGFWPTNDLRFFIYRKGGGPGGKRRRRDWRINTSGLVSCTFTDMDMLRSAGIVDGHGRSLASFPTRRAALATLQALVYDE
jgi:hypothetical protein